ncbi:MAG TPA: signal peptidase II [Anaerolineales bacterium]|nr:signal peptidase II [Anaerolineales bacterium]
MTKIHRLTLAILVLFFCTGFDQITKDVAREKLATSPPISLLNDTIRIQYSENTGATLGMGASLPSGVRFALFVLLNGLISITTLILALTTQDLRSIQVIGLLLVASGGLGNLLDRLFNNGAAIDFLNLGVGSIRTGIFNVADVLIIAGAAIFILFSLRDRKKAIAA